MLRRVALESTDVSEKLRASIMWATANVPSSLILFTLMMEAIRSSETSVQELRGPTSEKIAIFFLPEHLGTRAIASPSATVFILPAAATSNLEGQGMVT
jgi:hypothetical protein